ncbi:uncharacterized protein MONBRDRAFT_31107 [Monosiga brevicollis MX1]|uniref:SAP domain-containing protein n=1 Tax=Monosiga brevicollis TaxID=81824 RepID=A9URS4_MONBE|nr:uncharacterized protein MONBRDRAFT_31107 [Monosiga brevicollis MX1]EDQ91655.1 predicted protein [Monosiga brevicollis MX1]|eukprot:XP_001742941.1 hypothetical protein [Monosiga brevicollis MX1]
MAELPEDLSELTVVQLKKELSDRGITVKGRKADLVERLDEARTHEPEGTAAGEDGTSSPAESAPTKAAAEATSEPTTEDSAPAASETAKTDEADQERVGNVTAAEPKPVAQASTNVDAPAVAAATKEPQPQTTSTDSADASNGAPTPKRRRWRQSTEARQQSAEDAVIDANALQAMVQESLPTPAEAMDDGQDDVKEPKPGAMNRDNDAGTEDSTGPAAETGPCFVQVRNLKRPFTLIALKELLSQHGTILDNTFMTDKVRSRCFAKFETPAQARATADALNGMQWPSIHGQNLRVTVEATNTLAEQVAEQQAAAAAQHRERMIVIRALPPHHVLRECALLMLDPIETRLESAHLAMAMSVPVSVCVTEPPTADAPKQARPAAPRKPKEEPVVGLLDDLFRKTKTHPHLYWLPNSEAEAQAEGERRRERQAAKEARERAPARRSLPTNANLAPPPAARPSNLPYWMTQQK